MEEFHCSVSSVTFFFFNVFFILVVLVSTAENSKSPMRVLQWINIYPAIKFSTLHLFVHSVLKSSGELPFAKPIWMLWPANPPPPSLEGVCIASWGIYIVSNEMWSTHPSVPLSQSFLPHYLPDTFIFHSPAWSSLFFWNLFFSFCLQSKKHFFPFLLTRYASFSQKVLERTLKVLCILKYSSSKHSLVLKREAMVKSG